MYITYHNMYVLCIYIYSYTYLKCIHIPVCTCNILQQMKSYTRMSLQYPYMQRNRQYNYDITTRQIHQHGLKIMVWSISMYLHPQNTK